MPKSITPPLTAYQRRAEAICRAEAGVRMLKAGEIAQAQVLFTQACEWASS